MGDEYVVSSTELTASLITPVLRRALADLNRQFLEPRIATLHALFRGPGIGSEFSLEEDSAIEWIGRCPFSLFEMRMSDSPVASMQVGDVAPITVFQPHFEDQALAQAVLILGSQLSNSSRLTLAMVLGPSPVPHTVVRNTPVTQLPLWLKARHLLRVRWLDHPHFWPMLFTSARERNDRLLARAHALGLALLVGELV